MKHFWISLIILIVLLCGSIFSNLYSTFLCEEINGYLLQAEECHDKGDAEGTSRYIESALSLWDSHSYYLHILYPHEDVDEIQLDFQELRQLSEHHEQGGEYESVSARLMRRIDLLYEMDQVSWTNIF